MATQASPSETSAPVVAAGAPKPAVRRVNERPALKPDEVIESWYSLSIRANAVLLEPAAGQVQGLINQVDADMLKLIEGARDASLLLLIHGAGSQANRYSVMHALLVGVVCDIASRSPIDWNDDKRCSLRRAALTMNIAMTRLQDLLAVQDTPVTADQRSQIQGHAQRGSEQLREMGVTDKLWLEAVARHHDAPAGPLAAQSEALQLARLIQRADIFAARLSPRHKRTAMSGTGAAKAAYFDEQEQPDEAGSLIIKAVGLYPPGSYVELADGEVAIVLSPGISANKPVVASVISASGTPMPSPTLRRTEMKAHFVTRGVPPHEVRVQVPLEALLRLLR